MAMGRWEVRKSCVEELETEKEAGDGQAGHLWQRRYKDFNLRKEGERCRDHEHGKGSCAQQLGEAAWRGARGCGLDGKHKDCSRGPGE